LSPWWRRPTTEDETLEEVFEQPALDDEQPDEGASAPAEDFDRFLAGSRDESAEISLGASGPEPSPDHAEQPVPGETHFGEWPDRNESAAEELPAASLPEVAGEPPPEGEDEDEGDVAPLEAAGSLPAPSAPGERREEAQARSRRRRSRRRGGGGANHAGAERESVEVLPEVELRALPETRPAERPRLRGEGEAGATDLVELLREALSSAPARAAEAADEPRIAVFCDLENIALGVRDSEVKKFDIDMVLERLLEKGKIIVKRAYADWERYSDYKRALHTAAIELIDIPRKHYSGKNSADIKLVVDAMDLCYSKEHLDTFVILSGDSDFSPLVSKLKENNKHVVGIGVKNSSSALFIDNCDEFIYYEDIWRDAQQAPLLDGLTKEKSEAFSLMIDSILALKRENKDVLWGSMIKQTMQRKRPSFSEGYYGYSTFSELLEDAERYHLIRLKKDQRSGTYVVTGFAGAKRDASSSR
jgi:uncharacterized protein (TIGR00288 family)